MAETPLINFRPSATIKARLDKLFALSPDHGFKSYIVCGLINAALADMRETGPASKSHCAQFRAELSARVNRTKAGQGT